jgi:type II secretory pathway pseudopilin PulG
MQRSVASEAGTGDREVGGQSGFTMAGVIVVMAIMAIMLTVAVQSATFHKKRENELELVFRGEQFAEAVRLFRARNGRFPLKLEELVKAKPRVLRQQWKDPITGKFDWVPVFFGQGGTQVDSGGGATPTQTPGPFSAPTPAPTNAPDDEGGDGGGGEGGGESGGGRQRGGKGKQEKQDAPFPAVDATGPIIGVHSRSKDATILVRDGRSRYCDWNFTLEQRQGQGGQGGGPGKTQPTPHP